MPGFGMGFNRGQRKAFRAAARRQQLPSFFDENPTAKTMFEARIGGQGTKGQIARSRRLATRAGYPMPILGGHGGVPNPGNGNAGADAYEPNSVPMGKPHPGGPQSTANIPNFDAAPGSGSRSSPTFAGIAGRYNPGMGDTFDATSNYLTNALGQLVGPHGFDFEDLANTHLGIRGSVPMAGDAGKLPDFEEQMNTYRQLSDRELARAAANQKEQFSSMGGRYSQDMLRADSDLRRNALTDLTAQGYSVLSGLNTQRQQENQQRLAWNELLAQREQGLLGAGGQLAGMEATGRENAANRAWEEYGNSRAPNPFLEALLNWGTSFNPAGTVVY